MRFARVVRASSPAPEAPRDKPAGGELSVEFWGVRVAVPTGFDRATLAAVLDGVQAHGGTRAGKR